MKFGKPLHKTKRQSKVVNFNSGTYQDKWFGDVVISEIIFLNVLPA
jgi:hypothetical protein